MTHPKPLNPNQLADHRYSHRRADEAQGDAGLTTTEERDAWMRALRDETKALQRTLPAGAPKILARAIYTFPDLQ